MPAYGPAAASDERSLSIVAHLLGLTSLLGLPGFIGPLILFLTRRHLNVPSVDHAREALNFNLSIALYTIGGGILAFILTIATMGIALIPLIPVWIAFGIFAIGAPCYAAYQASQGIWWEYPLTIRFFTR